MVKRAAVMAHYDSNDRLAPYVLYYLECLKEVASDIIFVSTARLPAAEQEKVTDLGAKVILRENKKYDFGSWEVGLGCLNLDEFDEILICNDSVFGPLYPLSRVFAEMEGVDCSFWGVTNSFEINEHIQSYFMVFKKSVITSLAFRSFWNNIEEQASKFDIVCKYEIGLTQTLRAAGFKYSVIVPFRRRWVFAYIWQKVKKRVMTTANEYSGVAPIPGRVPSSTRSTLKTRIHAVIRALKGHLNPTHYFWRQTLINKSPFIKIDLLLKNPTGFNSDDWQKYIQSLRHYPTLIIREHLDFKRRVRGDNQCGTTSSF